VVTEDTRAVRAGRRARLSPERERDLLIATEAGDRAACRQLVDAFLPAIAAIARTYATGAGVERRELMQEGVVGLLRAVRRYDPRLNTPFWAYASWWVRQAMQKLVAEMTRPVALSDRALRGIALIKAARSEHVREHGREPTNAELAAATGFTRAQLDSLLAIELAPRALDEPSSVEDGTAESLGEMIADVQAEQEYERVLDAMESLRVRDLTLALDERERTVLSSHYGLGRDPQTLREIGDGLGLTAERVRQIEAAALRKLRDAAVLDSESVRPIYG
jgi:RNA polymerase sigma factor (sigma-70 family)